MLVCFLDEGDERVYERKKSKRYNWFNYKMIEEYYDPSKYMIIDYFTIDDFEERHENKAYVLTKRNNIKEVKILLKKDIYNFINEYVKDFNEWEKDKNYKFSFSDIISLFIVYIERELRDSPILQSALYYILSQSRK